MKKIVLPILIGCMIFGCSKPDEITETAKTPVVYTVNYPLAYFAERIAGDAVDIVFPEMEGDPAFWNPSPEQIVEFQNADLILLNGADYAKWVSKVSLPQSRLVNTSAGLDSQLIARTGEATHVHGPGGAHAHGDLAFTLWLNPDLARHQSLIIYKGLSELHETEKDGLDGLIADLRELDHQLNVVFQSLENQPLLGSHPVYQYLAQRYNLNLQSVHWEPDATPDKTMWRELDDILEAHDAKIMLWEDEPLPQVKKALLEKGIESIVFNPCGNRPEAGDYLSVMQDNLHAVKGLPSIR